MVQPQPHHHPTHAYTSQRENMEIGLYYYNARYYAPTLARFISADTIVPDPANPQSFNRYSYVLNSPLILTDPTGHWYYEPSCDCLAATEEPYNEYPENLQILHRTRGGPWSIEERLHAIVYSAFELGIENKDAGTQAASALCELYTNCTWQETIEAYTRPDPDYITFELSGGMGFLPPWAGLNVDFTRDRYGNWYAGGGLNIGKTFPSFGAARIVGGMILQSRHMQTEEELKSFIRGISVNVAGGVVGGFGLTIPLSLVNPRAAGELGFHTPQIGISATWMGLVYDNNSDTPWFWQN
jgi:RHS repeat-associated protein